MTGTIIITVLILALLAMLPRWAYSRRWGYGPSGGISLMLVVVIVLMMMGRI